MAGHLFGVSARPNWWLRRLASLPFWWLVVAVTVLYSPIFAATPTLDDRFGQQALSGADVAPVLHPPWDLYRICEPVAEVSRGLETWGGLHWYVDPNAKIAHFRPLSSLSLAFDYWIAPGNAAWGAAHGLFWYVVLLVGLRRLYGRWFTRRWLAGLAVVLFAIDDTHTFTVGWAANRHLLLSSCALVWGWLAHLRWREQQWRSGVWWAVLAFALGFASGEAMVGLCGYVVIDSLVRESGSWRARLWPLRFYAPVVGLWAALYLGLGYGTSGSGVYAHPVEEPASFVNALLRWGPVHWLAQFTPLSADLGMAVMIEPDSAPWLMTLCIPLACVLAYWGWRILADVPHAVPLMLGLAVNVLVVSAGIPGDRNLLAAGIGGSALTAMLIGALVGTQWQRRARIVVLTIHVVLPVIGLPLRAHLFTTIGPAWDRAAARLELKDADVPVVMLTTPGMIGSLYFAIARHQLGLVAPRRIEQIGSTHDAVLVTRMSSRRVRLETKGQFTSTFDDLPCRRPELPFAVGEHHALAIGSIEVVRLGTRGLPQVLELELEYDPAGLIFVRWTDEGFAAVELPAVGETMVLPATSRVPLGARVG